jgi:anti-sigma factor RsiW
MADLHLTEDDLVLHYYGETTRTEDAAAMAHLDSCPRCRGEYTRLQRVLGAVDEASLSTDLPSSFERTVWARLEPNLRWQRGGWRSWLGLTGVAGPQRALAVAAAIAVLVLGAFYAGRSTSRPAPAPVAAAVVPEQLRERILLVDLGQHLERSQMVLVELVSNEPAGQIDISDERARATELVADNRLYRQAAELSGDVAIMDLLDDIERVLTEVAATPDRLSPSDLADVRQRIESRDLLFKVRVVSSEVRERQREALQRRIGQRS